MSKRLLRIRLREKISTVSVDWHAGRHIGYETGHEQGVKDGEANFAHDKVHLLRMITELETKVADLQKKRQEDSRTVIHSKQEAARLKELVKNFEMENATLRRDQRIDSDWLQVPPFMIVENSAIDRDKFVMHQKHMASLYGGTVTGRSRSRNFPAFTENQLDQPEFMRRLHESIFARHPMMGLVDGSRGGVVQMSSPERPPSDPVFHWSAEHEQAADGEPITELRSNVPANFLHTESERLLTNVREAFRMPMPVTPGMRTEETEEGIRQASAEGVTNMAGGHSHSIDFDIRVDDSQLQDAIARIDQLGEAVGNAVVSGDQFEEAMLRLLRVETHLGIATTEEEASPDQTHERSEARSDPPGTE